MNADKKPKEQTEAHFNLKTLPKSEDKSNLTYRMSCKKNNNAQHMGPANRCKVLTHCPAASDNLQFNLLAGVEGVGATKTMLHN
jgi:hypothetical protein